MTKQSCYKILVFFFFVLFFIASGYSQNIPEPRYGECEGTQVKTDDGLVYVKKGERKTVKIAGKWYICVGCEGCVEVETDGLSSLQADSGGMGGRSQKETVDEYDLWAQKYGFANFQDYFNKKKQVAQQYQLESLIAEGNNRRIIEVQARELYTRLKKLSSQIETAEAFTEAISAADWGIRAVRASDLETARKWAGYFFDTAGAATKMSNYSFSDQEDLTQALKELKEIVPACLQIQEKLAAAREKKETLQQKSSDIKLKKDKIKDEVAKLKDENKKEELKQEITKLESEESDLLKEAQQLDQETSEMIKKAGDYADKADKIEKLLNSQGQK
jgi:hypothetical protein